jgi:hypothetical protein
MGSELNSSFSGKEKPFKEVNYERLGGPSWAFACGG